MTFEAARKTSQLRNFLIVLATLAVALSGAALAIALTHSGPQGRTGAVGPQGVQGKQGIQGEGGNAGQAATTGRMGVCWTSNTFTQTWSDGTSSTWVSGISLDPAQVQNGVYQCPSGETFVSIVPQPVKSSVGGQ